MDPAPRTDQPDAYAPAAMAARVEGVGIAKARMPLLQTFVLAALAGAFIAFGGMFYTLVMTGTGGVALGPARLLGGVAFSLGLILVLVGGAELFTGNSLIVMAWASRKITGGLILRNWTLVYVGNLVGALGMVALVAFSGMLDLGGGAVGATAMKIAQAKVALSPLEAFVRGILCNALVCLAVWLCFAARSATDKILAIVFPISAFVALGFEHSIANMYLIPVGALAGAHVTLAGFVANLIPVTIGNIFGGGVFVALIYWLVYLRAPNGGAADPEA